MPTHVPRRQNRSSRAPRAHSQCWIALNPWRAPFWPPRCARRNLRMCFRLIRPVSTRRATQSCIDPAFWAEPFWRPGASHARSKAKGAPTRSSLGERGAVPAGYIGLFPAPSANELTRRARRCGEGLPRNLQRRKRRVDTCSPAAPTGPSP
jgi:hypothetical protein